MNAFTRHFAMTGKLNPKKPKRRKNRAEKPRLGKVTVQKVNGAIRYNVKLNPPKPRKLTVNSRSRKK